METKNLIKQKPAMKWVGNKLGTPIADRVAELYKPFRKSHIWIEPFVGIGGMLLAIDPDYADCFDASAEVIGLHQWILSGGECVDFPKAWDSDYYYQQREVFRTEQALYAATPNLVALTPFFSRMIWLNKACFNGLWRVNKSGAFNAPIGAKANGQLNSFNQPSLPVYKKGWCFAVECNPLPDLIGNGFFYADPPYWGTHSSYTSEGFTWADQVDLAESMAARSQPVVISNSSSPEIVSLYKSLGFAIELIPVRRSISCKGSDRPSAIEVLASKNC
jgi:DNA adenine methylase